MLVSCVVRDRKVPNLSACVCVACVCTLGDFRRGRRPRAARSEDRERDRTRRAPRGGRAAGPPTTPARSARVSQTSRPISPARARKPCLVSFARSSRARAYADSPKTHTHFFVTGATRSSPRLGLERDVRSPHALPAMEGAERARHARLARRELGLPPTRQSAGRTPRAAASRRDRPLEIPYESLLVRLYRAQGCEKRGDTPRKYVGT